VSDKIESTNEFLIRRLEENKIKMQEMQTQIETMKEIIQHGDTVISFYGDEGNYTNDGIVFSVHAIENDPNTGAILWEQEQECGKLAREKQQIINKLKEKLGE